MEEQKLQTLIILQKNTKEILNCVGYAFYLIDKMHSHPAKPQEKAIKGLYGVCLISEQTANAKKKLMPILYHTLLTL